MNSKIKKFVNSDKVVTIEVVDGYIEGQSTGLFNLKGDNIKVEKILLVLYNYNYKHKIEWD